MPKIKPIKALEDSPVWALVTAQLKAAEHALRTDGFINLKDPEVDWKADYPTARREHIKKLPPIGNPIMRKLVRRIAKDINLPVVIIETSYWHTGNHMPVPRSKVTLRMSKSRAPLVANFIILGNDKHAPVRFNRDTKNWYVYFSGPEGQEILARWCDALRTDPNYRKALRRPPIPTEVTQ